VAVGRAEFIAEIHFSPKRWWERMKAVILQAALQSRIHGQLQSPRHPPVKPTQGVFSRAYPWFNQFNCFAYGEPNWKTR
jgi:hypothetical protein